MIKKLSIIVPVFNEEKNISKFLNRLYLVLKKINLDYDNIFVLDPSSDDSEKIIKSEITNNSKIKLIVFFKKIWSTVCNNGRDT